MSSWMVRTWMLTQLIHWPPSATAADTILKYYVQLIYIFYKGKLVIQQYLLAPYTQFWAKLQLLRYKVT